LEVKKMSKQKEQTLPDLIAEAREATRELREALKDVRQERRALEELRASMARHTADIIRNKFDEMAEAVITAMLEELKKEIEEHNAKAAENFREGIEQLGKLFLNGVTGGEPLEAYVRQRRLEFERYINEARMQALAVQKIREQQDD
jgi:predicted transcriptional regulator